MAGPTEEELRRSYIARLPQRMAELVEAVSALRAIGPGAPEPALRRVHTIVHRMVGTGGSYGLRELAAAAREAEDLLRPPLEGERSLSSVDLDDLDQRVERIREAVRRASGGTASGSAPAAG